MVPRPARPSRSGHAPAQLLLLGVTPVVPGFLRDAFVGLPAGRPADLSRRGTRVNHWLDIVSGTVSAGLAVRLAVTSPKQKSVNRRLTPPPSATYG
jgi:threonine/homoserine/homoserine lactone efflux protein